MTNIIFLDIDGVLLPFKMAHPKPNFLEEHPLEVLLPPEHIDLVNKLAKENNAEIVVSSSWRLHDDSLVFNKLTKDYKPFDLRSFLKRSGLTASFANDWHTPRGERFSEIVNGMVRGVEIYRWLQEHPEIENWVSLDDDSSGFSDMNIRNHLAKTDPYKGFVEEDYKIANLILKGV